MPIINLQGKQNSYNYKYYFTTSIKKVKRVIIFRKKLLTNFSK